MDIRIIYNPKSGKQKYKIKVKRLYDELKKDYDVKLHQITKEDRIDDVACGCCNEGADLIIGCGGDGTVNKIVNGIMKSNRRCKLATLPIGSANDYCSYMKISKNIDKFVKYIKKGKFEKIDIGQANDTYFINVASAGIFSDLGFLVPTFYKKIFGKFAYYFYSLKYLSHYIKQEHSIDFRLNEGNWQTKNTSFFLVMKTPYVGGFKNILTGVKNNDGYLHLIIMEKVNFQNMVEIVFELILHRKLKHRKLKTYKVKKVEINSDYKMDVDLDGEYGGELPMIFTIKESAIEMLSNRYIQFDK